MKQRLLVLLMAMVMVFACACKETNEQPVPPEMVIDVSQNESSIVDETSSVVSDKSSSTEATNSTIINTEITNSTERVLTEDELWYVENYTKACNEAKIDLLSFEVVPLEDINIASYMMHDENSDKATIVTIGIDYSYCEKTSMFHPDVQLISDGEKLTAERIGWENDDANLFVYVFQIAGVVELDSLQVRLHETSTEDYVIVDRNIDKSYNFAEFAQKWNVNHTFNKIVPLEGRFHYIGYVVEDLTSIAYEEGRDSEGRDWCQCVNGIFLFPLEGSQKITLSRDAIHVELDSDNPEFLSSASFDNMRGWKSSGWGDFREWNHLSFYAYTYQKSNSELYEQLEDAIDSCIVTIDGGDGCEDYVLDMSKAGVEVTRYN